MEDEICPYATFHLLGFREEMDPNKAMNFQTFPHQNGHGGHAHSRNSSQSMVSSDFISYQPIFPLFPKGFVG
jgi:Down syndrome cell adhesion molecule-like protein 1